MGMTAAWCVGLITPDDLKTFADASSLAWPQPSWLHLDFNPGLIPAFLASGVAAGLRAVGVITTCQRLNNAAWRRPDTQNIRKGVLADGLSNVIGGSLGVTGMSIDLVSCPINNLAFAVGQLAVFPRCSLDPYEPDMGASLAP
jgi:xanthine permease XanP